MWLECESTSFTPADCGLTMIPADVTRIPFRYGTSWTSGEGRKRWLKSEVRVQWKAFERLPVWQILSLYSKRLAVFCSVSTPDLQQAPEPCRATDTSATEHTMRMCRMLKTSAFHSSCAEICDSFCHDAARPDATRPYG